MIGMLAGATWATTISGGLVLPVLSTVIAAILIASWRAWRQAARSAVDAKVAATKNANDAENSRQEILRRLDAQDKALVELRPNGGGSIADAVRRVDRRVQELHAAGERREARIDGIDKRLDGIDHLWEMHLRDGQDWKERIKDMEDEFDEREK